MHYTPCRIAAEWPVLNRSEAPCFRDTLQTRPPRCLQERRHEPRLLSIAAHHCLPDALSLSQLPLRTSEAEMRRRHMSQSRTRNRTLYFCKQTLMPFPVQSRKASFPGNMIREPDQPRFEVVAAVASSSPTFVGRGGIASSLKTNGQYQCLAATAKQFRMGITIFAEMDFAGGSIHTLLDKERFKADGENGRVQGISRHALLVPKRAKQWHGTLTSHDEAMLPRRGMVPPTSTEVIQIPAGVVHPHQQLINVNNPQTTAAHTAPRRLFRDRTNTPAMQKHTATITNNGESNSDNIAQSEIPKVVPLISRFLRNHSRYLFFAGSRATSQKVDGTIVLSNSCSHHRGCSGIKIAKDLTQ